MLHFNIFGFLFSWLNLNLIVHNKLGEKKNQWMVVCWQRCLPTIFFHALPKWYIAIKMQADSIPPLWIVLTQCRGSNVLEFLRSDLKRTCCFNSKFVSICHWRKFVLGCTWGAREAQPVPSPSSPVNWDAKYVCLWSWVFQPSLSSELNAAMCLTPADITGKGPTETSRPTEPWEITNHAVLIPVSWGSLLSSSKYLEATGS